MVFSKLLKKYIHSLYFHKLFGAMVQRIKVNGIDKAIKIQEEVIFNLKNTFQSNTSWRIALSILFRIQIMKVKNLDVILISTLWQLKLLIIQYMEFCIEKQH